MGLDNNGTKFLLYAGRRGVSFEKTAMVGRQEMLADTTILKKNLRLFETPAADAVVEQIQSGSDNYAEGFLQFLGAREIVSFDASPYESASVVHDFNEPIPAEFKNRFSTVLDGGTLEHVFNFPVAIKNCMEMVAEGGHFLAITPANNYFGHGFYQFSPDLFFRIFSAQNGFELQHLMVFEETGDSPWYDVVDPELVKERVWLRNGQPTLLLVIARKIKTMEIFRARPQQSDYVTMWNGLGEPAARRSAKRFAGFLKLPLTVLRRIISRVAGKMGSMDRRPKHFKKIDLP